MGVCYTMATKIKLADKRKEVQDALLTDNQRTLTGALREYFTALEGNHTGLTFPDKKKVISEFVGQAVVLRGHYIVDQFLDSMDQVMKSSKDKAVGCARAASFFTAAPSLYQRLEHAHIEAFVDGAIKAKAAPEYFGVGTPEANQVLTELVEKEHLESVKYTRKMKDEYRQDMARADAKLSNAKSWGIAATVSALVLGALATMYAHTKSPDAKRSHRDQVRIEQMVRGVDYLTRERNNLQTKLSQAETDRDQARAAINTTYGSRMHETPDSQPSLLSITDDWLDTVGGRVRIYGPGCEAALGNLHAAMGGYSIERGRFVRALNDAVCPGISPIQEYVEFSK